MSGALHSSVTAEFTSLPAGFQLTITGDEGSYSDLLTHLLLFPNVPATVRCDYGEVTLLGATKIVNVPGGTLQFNYTEAEAQQGTPPVTIQTLAKPPINSTPQFEVLFAFDPFGNPTTVNVYWDSAYKVARATKGFTGVVRYKPYLTQARLMVYQPEELPLPDGGVAVTYGIIAAYYQGNMTTYQTQAPQISKGEADTELYRVYSNKVITPDGEFEQPPNYPTSGSYPGKSLVLDVTTALKVERVHEIGYINAQGRAFVQTQNVSVLEPYIGDISYSIKTQCRKNTLDPKKYPPNVISTANDFVKSQGLGCK